MSLYYLNWSQTSLHSKHLDLPINVLKSAEVSLEYLESHHGMLKINSVPLSVSQFVFKSVWAMTFGSFLHKSWLQPHKYVILGFLWKTTAHFEDRWLIALEWSLVITKATSFLETHQCLCAMEARKERSQWLVYN